MNLGKRAAFLEKPADYLFTFVVGHGGESIRTFLWRKHAGFPIICRDMSAEISKAYDPKLVEDKWYAAWLKAGHFTANPTSAKPPYSIVIPPPNVTGVLTMGHVLNNTLQDILARRKRMQGYEVLWLPGTDHAGIATQTVVEKTLRKQGVIKHRDDLGREKFLEKVWEWKDKHGGIIIQQLKKLGCSCDWSRERFTMDEAYSRAVLQTFVDLYNKGYIYRGQRMVNWDPAGRTALSDEEVIMTETQGHLWHIRYADEIIVATTRPETMLGDEAVAVHPDDPRYRHLIGRKLTLPLQNRQIPVIADAAVDPKFGTGCVKVTPAHDVADYEMALRHNLPFNVVIGPDGLMTEAAGEDFEGLDRLECREAVVEQLKEAGLLVKVEDYTHNVGYSERTNVPIEPYLSEQWFLKYPQVPRSTAAVETDAIKFYPERWQKTYTHWMKNIRDWCISRQLWWGHRIPVWYRGAEIYCGLEAPQDAGWTQDSDVLDTWFSSWLWPFATMDDSTQKKFYPTTDLVTGPDIIFFWVARMIMAGYEYTDTKPFSNVYFTGIIRDAQGRKMSKSLGNSPDPLDLIAKYGADGLRFGLMLIAPQGQDILFDEKRCEVGRNFMNKLWNAARFIQMQQPGRTDHNAHDLKILFEMNDAITKVTAALDAYKFSEATKELYDFVWGDFCDWYIEASKVSPNVTVLNEVFNVILRLLHPFAPFITEELWRGTGTIQFAPWPTVREIPGATAAHAGKMDELYAVIGAGRQLRNDYNLEPKKRLTFVIKTGEEIFLKEVASLEKFLNADITVNAAYTPTGVTPSLVTKTATVFMVGAVDAAQERQRLTKQLADIEKQLTGTEAKLANENFVAKAAPVAVQREREKLAMLREQKDKLQALLVKLV
ncbi:MAG: Valine--tRNA ligase [Verrucomicrobiae bacterium]|nr:Valine--tRNA ligase [Verrucomicrobiae bacterium]